MPLLRRTAPSRASSYREARARRFTRTAECSGCRCRRMMQMAANTRNTRKSVVPPRTIAFANEKGGTAKTTTTVNLAAALAGLGKRVLVVDFDPQAKASKWLGASDGGRGLLDVLTDRQELAPLAVATTTPRLELIPSSKWLANADRALAREVGAEHLFRKALAALPTGRWDFVLVDCPPSLGLLVVSALAACREVVIPVEARPMALDGVVDLVQTIDTVRERLNPTLTITGFLPCRCDARIRISDEVVSSLRAHFGREVFRTAIRENVRLSEAWGHQKPIALYDPRSVGAADHEAVARELLTRAPKHTQPPKRKHL